MANCLFCSSAIPPTFTIVEETVKKVKSGFSLSFGGTKTCEDSAVHDHLKTFLVLKRVLNLPNKLLSALLRLCNGESYPEHWIGACESCDQLVSKFYGVLKEISKLEESLVQIEGELKRKIGNSEDVAGASPIWTRIRQEVLNPKESKTTSSEKIHAETQTDEDKNGKSDDSSPQEDVQEISSCVLIGLRSDTEDDHDGGDGGRVSISTKTKNELAAASEDQVLQTNVSNTENQSMPERNLMDVDSLVAFAAEEAETLEAILVTPVYSFASTDIVHSHKKRKSTSSKSKKDDSDSDSPLIVFEKVVKPMNNCFVKRNCREDTPSFECHRCKYSTEVVAKLEDHLKLHDDHKNSGFEPCPRPNCNALVLMGKMEEHYQLEHSSTTAKVKNSVPSKLCDKCGRFYNNVTYHRRQECNVKPAQTLEKDDAKLNSKLS